MAAVGDRVQMIGDDLLVTNARRVAEAARERSANAVLIKVNQAGTVTRREGGVRRGPRAEGSARSSRRARARPRTSPSSISPIGWGAGQLKVGSFARSERMAKWNEVLRIEEALGTRRASPGWMRCPRVAAVAYDPARHEDFTDV